MITLPVAIPPPSLPLPDPGDRATFSVRKLEHLRWAAENLAPGANLLAATTYGNAQDATQSASDAYANAVATSSNAQAAASFAGAAPWAAGTYALGAVVYSPATRRIFRKTTASSATTIDPGADPANWSGIKVNRPLIIVSTAAVTASAGFAYLLIFAGVVTVTAPAVMASEDAFDILVANGRIDNVLNPNGATVFGVAGNMTIDNAFADVKIMYANSTLRVSK